MTLMSHPKRRKIEDVVIHRICPKQDQDFKPSVVAPYPTWIKYPPPPQGVGQVKVEILVSLCSIDI